MKPKLFITLLTLMSAVALVTVLATGCKELGNIADVGGQLVGGTTGNLVSAGGKAIKAASLSERDEQEMGRSVAIVVTNKYRLSDDSKLTDYVTLVGLTVAMSSPRTDHMYYFGVLETDEIGAFSGPTGYIMITRGALKRMRDESELAGVLAHEIGHVCKQHGLEAVRQAGLIDAAVQAVNTNKEIGQFGLLVDGAADVVLKKGYSRSQETEADTDAVKYLIASGYDPRGFVRFLQRTEAEMGNGGGAMSTHPGTHERISAVSAQINQANPPAGATLKDRYVRSTISMR